MKYKKFGAVWAMNAWWISLPGARKERWVYEVFPWRWHVGSGVENGFRNLMCRR